MANQLASNWIQTPVNSEVYEKSVTIYDAFMLMLKPKGGRFSACNQFNNSNNKAGQKKLIAEWLEIHNGWTQYINITIHK